MAQNAKVFKLNLLDNGIDFIKSGIETYFMHDEPDPRAHKYAILHVFAGTLLILKECLARAHPSLIFENVAHYGRPSAKTTNYRDTIDRLKAMGVIIDPAKLAILDEIHRLRNAIEHYEVELTLDRSKEVIGELAAFLYGFCADKLNVRIDDFLIDEAKMRFYELQEIGDRLYEEAMADAEAEYRADDEYFAEFGRKYSAMTIPELLAYAKTLGSVQRARCETCEDSEVLLLEVAVCLSNACRAWYRSESCTYCLSPARFGAHLCNSCRSG